MNPRKTRKEKIGELLKERKLVNSEQLEQALKQQKKNGGYLSQHLISLGLVSEKDIAECLAVQYGYPYLSVTNYTIAPEMLELIPFRLIDIYSIVPVDKVGHTISVAMADPLNTGVIEMLKQITKSHIAVFISTYSEIREIINAKLSGQMKDIKSAEKKEMELLEKEMLSSFIQVKGFNREQEKRKHRRFEVDLDMVYYLRDKSYHGTVKDISYNGILFGSDLFIPLEETVYGNIIVKMHLHKTIISAVLQVLRVEKNTIKKIDPSDQKTQNYNISGFFNFITDDDRKNLVMFLKKQNR